ncbi:transposase [Streptomyces avermitilis]|uniref:transposase n=1 Tax=Streptomyces avermitilis TaxID=33903 RepID=UPI0036C8F419
MAGRKGHVAVGCLGLLLVVLVTAASMQDRDAGIPLLTRLRSLHRRITPMWDDGGYAGQLVDWARKRTDDATGFVVLPSRSPAKPPQPGAT